MSLIMKKVSSDGGFGWNERRLADKKLRKDGSIFGAKGNKGLTAEEKREQQLKTMMAAHFGGCRYEDILELAKEHYPERFI